VPRRVCIALASWVVFARRWAELNECASGPDEKALPDRDPDDGTTVFRYDYGGCPAHADVSFFAVQRGGHNWPGIPAWSGRGLNTQDIKASEEIGRFFGDHRHLE
jgi:polyhydroxybutyrate depolymerase